MAVYEVGAFFPTALPAFSAGGVSIQNVPHWGKGGGGRWQRLLESCAMLSVLFSNYVSFVELLCFVCALQQVFFLGGKFVSFISCLLSRIFLLSWRNSIPF